MTPRICLIWAEAEGRVIGKDGALPWRLAEDMQHFKALTMGKPCLMGRKTWDSLPEKFRPLPGRPNLVLSRDPGFAADGAIVVRDLAEAWHKAGALGDEVMVIGGAAVYAAALPFADRICRTEIHAAFEGDAFAPAINPACWTETAREDHISASGLAFRFVTLARRV